MAVGHKGWPDHEERREQQPWPHDGGAYSLVFPKFSRAEWQSSTVRLPWWPGCAPGTYRDRAVTVITRAQGVLKLRLSVRGDNRQNAVQQPHLTMHFKNRADIVKHKYFSACADWLTCRILPL